MLTDAGMNRVPNEWCWERWHPSNEQQLRGKKKNPHDLIKDYDWAGCRCWQADNGKETSLTDRHVTGWERKRGVYQQMSQRREKHTMIIL